MRQKHDSPLNWREARNFVPRAGEIIVYDKDDSIRRQRLKIGDGESLINDLNMMAGEVYSQRLEPLDASEGALWVVSEGNTEEATQGGLPDVLYFSYNGTPLPYLPNWDQSAYPQGFITVNNSGINFYVTKDKLLPFYGEDGVFNGVRFVYEKINGVAKQYYYRQWSFNKDTNTWETDGEEHSVTNQVFTNVIWTYKNILNSGTIALQATQPIPVYQYQVEKQYSDWNVPNKEKAGYIANRPVWKIEDKISAYWNPNASEEMIADEKQFHISSQNLASNNTCYSNLKLYTAIGDTPYTNIDFPETPYNYNNETWPYCIGRLSYNKGEADWSEARFYYSKTPFFLKKKTGDIYSGDYFANASESFLVTRRSDESTWSQATSFSPFENIFCPQEPAASGGDRFIFNANVLDEAGIIVYKSYNWTSILYGNGLVFGGNLSTIKQYEEVLIEANANSKNFFLADCSINPKIQLSSIIEIFNVVLSEEDAPIKNTLGFIVSEECKLYTPGIYFTNKGTTAAHISLFEFDYSSVEVNQNYSNVFKKKEAANIKILKSSIIENISIYQERENIEAASNLLKAEIEDSVSIGDIIAIPAKFINLL